ncbi:MAG: hypothetical protein M0R51_13640 [Clostridia bacterium]|nr:hypothetical protein [Clostridia bacterium]
MHSLSIIKRKDNQYDYLGKDETLFIELGEYGWGYDELHTAGEKLNYVLTKIYYDAIDEESLNIVKDLVLQKTGCDIEIENYNDGNFWIDHQSIDMLSKQQQASGLCYRDFIENVIFNPNYVIIIDNDNH